jgi:hypothetical protein
MTLRPLTLCTLLLVGLAAAGGISQAHNDTHSSDYRSMEHKIDYLQKNAARSKGDPEPTNITEVEANAYFNEGGVKLPKGVSHVHLTAQPGAIDGTAKVDFDAITASKRSSNPLLSLFSGVHDVHIVAQAVGTAGVGTVKVQTVSLDGIEVPQMALEFFAQRYLTPKYPNVGVTSTFKLPLRIDSATVDTGKVRLIQK